jgi:pimeloyl-ACP methyl ester carboxylesterase
MTTTQIITIHVPPPTHHAGFSQPAAGDDYSGESHVRQLRELITELRLHEEGYHLVGHSMGGALAALYAAKHPGEVCVCV